MSLLFTLAGCGDGGGLFVDEEAAMLEILTPHYETDVVIRTAAMELSAHISHPSPAGCEVAVTAPDTVSGFRYVFRQDNVDVLFKDLQFSYDAAAMPHTAPIGLTVQALAAMLRTDDAAALRAVDGGWELTGAVGASPCVMTLDEAGVPLELTLPDQGIAVSLQGFVYLRNEVVSE